MGKGVAPRPRSADRWGSAGSGAAGASRGRLFAFGAGPQHVLMGMRRVSQSNRHGNCKQRDRKSLQHRFFLPGHSVKKPPNAVAWFATRMCRIPSGTRRALFKANCGAADLDLNQPLPTPGGVAIDPTHPVACRKAWPQPETNRVPKRLHSLDRVRSHADLSHRPYVLCVRPDQHGARPCPQHRRDPRSRREGHSRMRAKGHSRSRRNAPMRTPGAASGVSAGDRLAICCSRPLRRFTPTMPVSRRRLSKRDGLCYMRLPSREQAIPR
jgi:hypothetical protein